MSFSNFDIRDNIESQFENIRTFNDHDYVMKKLESANTNTNNSLFNFDNNEREYNGTHLSDVPQQQQLTHTDCINLYFNPTKDDSQVSIALKHISKCDKCKNYIKNKLNSNKREELKREEIKQITQPKQEIQDITKYLEKTEEKLHLNNKLDKILEFLMAKQTNNMDKYMYPAYYTDRNYITNNPISHPPPIREYFTIDNNTYIYIGIIIIIILLLIDITIRLVKN